MKKISIIMFLAVLGISSVYAHGIWTAMRSDMIEIVYGEGPWDNRFDAQTLQQVKGYDENQKERKVSTQVNETFVSLVPDDSVQVITAYAMAYFSQDANGNYVKKPKNEVPGVKNSMFAKQYNVSYINQQKMLKKQKAMILIKKPKANKAIELEILPQVDPRSLKQGDELKVLVLKNGKPFGNAVVVPDVIGDVHHEIKTDKNGYATFKIRNTGLNVIATWSIESSKDTIKSDKDTIFSTLSFTLFDKNK
ncbi:DUF4198 domain-containing protein [Helicobacter sp. 11S03491-1]|uniref:DUF4198 domain-containing protein n=1 Tax=Helicobacter sp. 11S03491-1 TaxID=1476196 RepID=UPI000BA5D068|nr:DUF4198 domain-containing protein [Helicobacter sp. 11S03491-1]PAF41681.1 hypothetical protein BKH45_06205 [Helicobacter sp. 11S03491-1]